jgi:hypothetical protein
VFRFQDCNSFHLMFISALVRRDQIENCYIQVCSCSMPRQCSMAMQAAAEKFGTAPHLFISYLPPLHSLLTIANPQRSSRQGSLPDIQ